METKIYRIGAGWQVERWLGPSLKFNRWFPAQRAALDCVAEQIAQCQPDSGNN